MKRKLAVGPLVLTSLLVLSMGLLVSLGLLALVVGAQAAQAGDSPARGKILFLRCASCHDATPGQSAKIGPNLYGVVDRKVASQDGYPYSAALRAQDFRWDAAHLDEWLTNPNALAPGTAMAFAGIAEPAERRAIIAYLESQHASTPP